MSDSWIFHDIFCILYMCLEFLASLLGSRLKRDTGTNKHINRKQEVNNLHNIFAKREKSQ